MIGAKRRFSRPTMCVYLFAIVSFAILATSRKTHTRQVKVRTRTCERASQVPPSSYDQDSSIKTHYNLSFHE